MIRRNLVGFASAIALLGATACDSDSGTGSQDESDGAVMDGGGAPDSGGGAMDASLEADAGGGDPDGGSTLDAGMDAATTDAATTDAGMDAATETDAEADDAGPDAETELDASTDAGEDAGSDASTGPELPELAAWYKFDENDGTTTASSAGEFADAVLENGAGWTTGVYGSALDLAGGATGSSSNYVSLPADILDHCDDLTFALWMKLGSTPFWARILEIDSFTNGFLLFTPTQDIGGEPHLHFNIWSGQDHGVSAAYPAGTTLVDEWHHVAFTLSGGTGRLYFDGVEIGSNAMTMKPADLTLGENAHAFIGRTTTHPDPYLDATIDDLRISCTAYTAEQVAALAE